MPKKQTTAGKKARAAARAGEKYTTALRRHSPPGTPGAGAAIPPSLRHRVLLDHPPGFRPFGGTGLFERIGGQATTGRLVDLLYEGIGADDQLRPLFPRDLAHTRSESRLFFAEWLGGPRRYSSQAYAGLGQRHADLPITPALAGRWLAHFGRALAASVADENDRAVILAEVRSLAMTLVSRQAAPASLPGRRTRTGGKNGPWPVAWCGKGARIVTRARDLAHRGDVAGLGVVLAETPDLLGASFAAAIMQAAALAGRADVVRMLLDRGVGADRPCWLPVGLTGQAFERVIFATPLCAARMKRRPAVEALLVAAGAREDVFTAAFLGDLTSLARMLAADPGLAQATDPAVDVLAITPVDHAVAGGQPGALRLLLDQVADPVAGQVRALRGAAARGSLAMAELLLAHGADATRIGTGRWVLHPELAPLLAGHGAAIDSSGSWIGASCTGNQNRKDDPEYVRALLRYGASANDRRAGDPDGATGVRALNATALHYAARAGFLRTIEVLLDHGADPHACDSQGRTPLDWLDQAAPSVSRTAVRDLLGLRVSSGTFEGMELHVGCPMWTYAPWQGRYLPASLAPRERLRAYATWCNAVEGNTTFYAIPALSTVRSWAGQTSPGFRFVLKLPKAITHERRLADVAEPLRAFLAAVEPLGERAHALWVQLPPSFGPADTGALAGFLRRLPQRHRYCVEVRHRAFFTDPRSEQELERALGAVGAEWVPFDTTVLFGSPPVTEAEREAWRNKPRVPRRSRALTAYPIVRYLGRDDPERTVAGWEPWLGTVAGWLREGRSPTVFIHTPDNVDSLDLARRFHGQVRARVPEVEPLPEPVPAGPPTLF
ncbi:MAG TPA: DUF72 domain-containing protein [Streptosporangiaceae bacterium]|nr:DUF72 domain-containing protein [Streptosporangiaceae bacterium]